MRHHYCSTVMFNGASNSGFKTVLIICSWSHTFYAICQVFMKIFGLEMLQKSLTYALSKVQAQQTLNFDAAVCFLSTVY